MKLVPAVLAALAALTAAASARAEASGCEQRPAPVRLKVTIEGLRSSRGLVAITVYGDDPRRFLAKRGSLYVIRVPAKAPHTVACVPLPGAGVYALAVYHDQNGNRKIDRKGLLPSEPIGLSNDPPTILGIPSFRAVRFTAPAVGGAITIPLRNRRKG